MSNLANFSPGSANASIAVAVPNADSALSFLASVSVIAVAAGCAALFDHLRRRYTIPISVLTVVLLFGGTSLFWYVIYEPTARHAATFGLVAVFVVLAERWVRAGASLRQAAMLGALLGAAWLVRTDAALSAIVLPLLAFSRPLPLPQRARLAARLGTGVFLGLLPCLLLSGLAATRVLAPDVFDEGLAAPHLVGGTTHALFGAPSGFLSWNPVAYIAVIGTIALFWRDAAWASSALIVLFGLAWIATPASFATFAGGGFAPVLPLLAPGLALVLDFLRKRPVFAVAPLVVVALMWNYLLIIQYTIGLLPKDEPVSFARMVRQQADLHTQGRFFYPFAFPANAWFAWRESLPIDRYDLLSLEPRRTSADFAFDRVNDRFLLDGWDAPGRDEWGPVWWTESRRATLALPLDFPDNRSVRVDVVSRSRFEEPVMEAELGLEINGHEIGRLVAPAARPGEASFTIPAGSVGRILRAGYNRVTFVSHGVRRADPSDTRPEGPIARGRGSRPWPVAIYRIRMTPAQ